MDGEGRIETFVGLFWHVWRDDGPPELAADRLPLSEAEPYGDVLTHPREPDEVWEAWRLLGVGGLRARGLPEAIATSEHRQHPMGRIILFQAEGLFRIYCALAMWEPPMLQEVRWVFGLDGAAFELRPAS